MKKWVCGLLAVMILVCGVSCSKKKTSESSTSETISGSLYAVTVSPNSGAYCVMTPDDELQISTDSEFSSSVTWTTSDPKVATVEAGKVCPVGIGTAEVLCEDGTSSAIVVIMVSDTPDRITEAGALCIEKDGTVYGPNISQTDWDGIGEAPAYFTDANSNTVFLVNGEYYVRSSLLFNIVCCAVGESTVLEGETGEMPQLCGQADITDMNASPEADCLGEHTVLYTYPRAYIMPNGDCIGKDLYTVIAEDDVAKETVFYHTINVDGILYEHAQDYLDRFGIHYELKYDETQAVLTVKLV